MDDGRSVHWELRVALQCIELHLDIGGEDEGCRDDATVQVQGVLLQADRQANSRGNIGCEAHFPLAQDVDVYAVHAAELGEGRFLL